MARLTGALLIAAAGLLAGLAAAGELRERTEGREALVRMLEQMEFDLGRFSTPLPALFARLAGQMPDPAGTLCRRICDGFAGLDRRPMEEIWRSALQALPAPERRILLPLGQVLGRYGAQEQQAAVAACRRDMELARDEARTALRERGRVLVGVSAAAGAALAVLLI